LAFLRGEKKDHLCVFVQREIDRTRKSLLDVNRLHLYSRRYAALQALEWVLEPTGVKSPLDLLMGMADILATKEDCSVGIHPIQS